MSGLRSHSILFAYAGPDVGTDYIRGIDSELPVDAGDSRGLNSQDDGIGGD